MSDGQGHLLGQLAAIVAKQVPLGWKVVAVHCRASTVLAISTETSCGTSIPSQADQYQSIPQRLLLPRPQLNLLADHVRHAAHRTLQGQAAWDRLKEPDGTLPPDDKKKQMVVPAALMVVRLKSTRKPTHVGQLDHEVGWTSRAATAPLHERKKKAKNHH